MWSGLLLTLPFAQHLKVLGGAASAPASDVKILSQFELESLFCVLFLGAGC